MNKKRIIKHVVALIVICMLTVFTEHIICNWNAVTHKAYSHTYSEKNRDGYEYKKIIADGQIKYIIPTEGEYVDKIELNYRTNQYITYKVVVLNWEEDEDGNRELKETDSITDRAYIQFHRAVTKVESEADYIQITYSVKDLEEVNYPRLISVRTYNETNVLWYREMLIFGILISVYMIFTMRRTMEQHIEYAFFFVSVLFGFTIIAMAPAAFMSWDEEIHFNRAYSMTFEDTVEYSTSSYALHAKKLQNVNTAEEIRMQQEYLNEHVDDVVATSKKTSNFVDYSKRSYLPQAFGLKLGRTLGVDFTVTLWLGKIMNLLVYSFVMMLAIRYAKIGKRAMVCVGLLPTSVFLASTFSYDAFVTAFLMLGYVLLINEWLEKEERLNWKRVSMGIICIVIGSFSKAVYVPMLLILCFLPKEKFESKRQRIAFLASGIVVFLVMMSSFVLPTLTNAVASVEVTGDSRGGDTSVTRQIMYILGNPLEFIGMLLNNIWKTLGTYFLGYKSHTFLAYYGGDQGNYYLVSVALMVGVAFTEKAQFHIKRKFRVVTSIMLFGIIVLIWTAMYLSFTPVGLSKINGVQPRYYIPLMYPLMILFMPNKETGRFGDLAYNRIIMAANLFVIAGTIITVIMVPYAS